MEDGARMMLINGMPMEASQELDGWRPSELMEDVYIERLAGCSDEGESAPKSADEFAPKSGG